MAQFDVVRAWVGRLACVLLCLGYGSAIAQNDPSFNLVNRSQAEIHNIYVSSTQETNWGRDLLGDRTLTTGQQFKVEPPRDRGCVFDVRVVYQGGRFEERRNQNLCQVDQIAFDGSAARDPAPRAQTPPAAQQPPASSGGRTPNPDFFVVNRSSKVIGGVFVSSAQSTSWGADLIPNTLAPGERFQVRLPRDGQCVYDVRVVYTDKAVEERRQQDVCKVDEMAFTGTGSAPAGPQARGGQQPGQPAQSSGPRVAGYGTGFFVTGQGYALTNNHVIDGCDGGIAGIQDGQPVRGIVVNIDKQNDLALIRIQQANTVSFAKFRASPGIRVGESVIAAGFPFPQVLQNGLNVTIGNVSAMAGSGGNTANMQITAPVQPGNSGGPLMDASGHVVGVVVSRLNSQAVRAETQNINYAVQGPIARLFLDSNGVRASEQRSDRDIKMGDLSDAARDYTFQVVCYKR